MGEVGHQEEKADGKLTGRGKREGGMRGEGNGEKYTTLCYTLRSKKGKEVGVTKKMGGKRH